jgi:hypothetical protein
MKGKTKKDAKSKPSAHVNFQYLINLVSLIRKEVHIDLKYDEEQEKLEESKDEDIPSVQIAKVVEKNGKSLENAVQNHVLNSK